ncbi:MAG: response regulator, partial [Thermoanaerobaculia bacterium]
FVELLRGTIAVTSTLGEGSEFSFALPLRFSPMTVATPVIPPGEHVLVVEDEDDTFATLASHLQSAGYMPVRARSGEEALRLARSSHPRAITLDLVLPGIEGWQVLRDLKADAATAAIPVIVISILQNRELALAFGADDYFAKPVDWPRLMRRLAELTVASTV